MQYGILYFQYLCRLSTQKDGTNSGLKYINPIQAGGVFRDPPKVFVHNS